MRNWHLSTIFVALAAAATFHGIVACGGSEDAKTSSAVPTNFDGTYRPTSAGAISAISFAHGRDYVLMAKGCTTASCTEIGTYELDLSAKTLTLTDASTRSSRKVSLEILSTARRQPGSLTTKDLTEPEEQLTKGSDKKIVESGQQTTSSSGGGRDGGSGSDKLIELITQLLELIKSASMDGQDMKQDPASDAKSSSGDSAADAGASASCTSNLPTAESSAADIASYFVRCPAGILTGFLGGGGAGNK